MMPTFAKNQQSSLLSKFLYLGASEGLARATRLIAAIVLARTLSPIEFGIVALLMSADELIRVFSRNGIGMKVIRAKEKDLASMCALAYRWNWWISIGLCLLQIGIAPVLAKLFSFPELAPLLQIMAFTYLIYPLSMVNVFRVQRAQKMREMGMIYAGQVSLDNLLTAALALVGMGVWAVVIPKLLVAPLWVWFYRKIDTWRFDAKLVINTPDNFWVYCREVLLVELLRTARMTWDRIIIGAVLGVEALGIYYFAVNAGSGLAQSLIKAFNTVMMPHICHLNRSDLNASPKLDIKFSYQYCLTKYAQFIVPILLIQIVLAPWYVPIVFGASWASATPILMLLCAAMMFQGGLEILSPIFRAYNRTRVDLNLNLIVSITVLIVVALSSQTDLTIVATSLLFAQAVIFCVCVYEFLIKPSRITNYQFDGSKV